MAATHSIAGTKLSCTFQKKDSSGRVRPPFQVGATPLPEKRACYPCKQNLNYHIHPFDGPSQPLSLCVRKDTMCINQAPFHTVVCIFLIIVALISRHANVRICVSVGIVDTVSAGTSHRRREGAPEDWASRVGAEHEQQPSPLGASAADCRRWPRCGT